MSKDEGNRWKRGTCQDSGNERERALRGEEPQNGEGVLVLVCVCSFLRLTEGGRKNTHGPVRPCTTIFVEKTER